MVRLEVVLFPGDDETTLAGFHVDDQLHDLMGVGDDLAVSVDHRADLIAHVLHPDVGRDDHEDQDRDRTAEGEL